MQDTQMEINRKLLEHEFALDKLTEAIEHVAESSKESNNKLEKIAESMSKQEVILEKISNMDEKYSGSIARIYKRLEDIESKRDDKDKNGCVAMQTERIEREHLSGRVEKLEDSSKWLIRTIIGKVIFIILGAIGLIVKGS